jgi:hypothetical protein
LRAICADCGFDTAPCKYEDSSWDEVSAPACSGTRDDCCHVGRHEWYTVTDAVWAAAGMNPHLVPGFNEHIEILCVGCLETRLGRELTVADFTFAPLNGPRLFDTPRLAERKARTATA